jgi:hypothetical protein
MFKVQRLQHWFQKPGKIHWLLTVFDRSLNFVVFFKKSKIMQRFKSRFFKLDLNKRGELDWLTYVLYISYINFFVSGCFWG